MTMNRCSKVLFKYTQRDVWIMVRHIRTLAPAVTPALAPALSPAVAPSLVSARVPVLAPNDIFLIGLF